MATTRSEIDSWKARGRAQEATHLIAVCDTFSYEDYPVFVGPGEDLAMVKSRYEGINGMQRIMEVIDLRESHAA